MMNEAGRVTDESKLAQLIIEGDAARRLIPVILDLEYKDRKRELGGFLAELHNSGEITLLSNDNLAAIRRLEHNEFWMIFGALSDAIEHVVDDYPAVQQFAECLVEKAGNDGASNTPFVSFVRWCEKHPSQAIRIMKGAKDGQENCQRSCVFALQGLNDFGRLVDFLADSRAEIRSIGFRALGRLKNLTSQDDQTGIDACLSEILSSSSGDARNAAIEAVFRIWDKETDKKKYRQDEVLMSLLAKPSDEDLVRLCAMLFYHKNASTGKTISAVLSRSQSISSGFETASHWIESALTWKDVRWSFKEVVAFMEAMVPHFEQPVKSKQFHSFCEWVWEEPANASYLFARWLYSGDFSLCSFLAEMVSGGDKGAALSLLPQDLPSEAVDQVFLARKCIGFLWLHEVTAASILLSLIEHGHPDAVPEIEELLWKPLLLSYSSELRPYLGQQASSASPTVAKASQELMAKHAAYIEGLEQAQDLSELEPSNEARRAAAIKDHQRNTDIQKQARKMSVFGDMFHTATMLYGRKSFSLVTGGDGKKFPNITPLSEHSYSFEFPRLSVVDPVGFNGLLVVCRIEQRKTQ
ncbi:hypothetical protein DS901_16595 [Loktanella sp. D2R18]|uniref:HEAT repeat domain-containing protein n=1 Tax=Rhodobacterales TaxID=204455 RepID=UPI000DEB87E9|nr:MULTISPECIES: hypothetical protein [Rhodobacterales]MDO6591770.1 hypothetical protein [Yoonia sp. 1_MG-2023]RBW42312.1 hypothetical protein DS901_16595 [Loktanella sp. D2R18]